MTKKETKTLYFEIGTGFFGFIPKIFNKKEPDISDVSILRKLLSNERAKLLYVLKNEKINSIYALAKKMNREFKSVYSDLKLFEKYGFIEFIEEKKGKKMMLKPVLLVDRIELILEI